MLYAKKSNRVQHIQESDIQRYLNQGYDIVDAKGNVIIETMPDNVAGLQTAFKRHIEEISKLKNTISGFEAQMVIVTDENTRLMEENAELKAALEQAERARATKTSKAKKAKDTEVAEEATEDASNA